MSKQNKLYTHIISGDTQSKEDWIADIEHDIETNWDKELIGGVWLYSKPGTDEDSSYIPRTFAESCAQEFKESLTETREV